MTIQIPASGGVPVGVERPAGPPSPVVAIGPTERVVEKPATPKVQEPIRVDIKVNTEQRMRDLAVAVSELNDRLKDGGRGLSFTIDESVVPPVVTVKNDETGEVIRQIPTQTAVNMARSIDELKGYLLNNKT